MNPHVPKLLAKARRSLEAAHRNLGDADVETAISRAYYAAFYAASAALLAEGQAPKTHVGVHKQFFERFVSTGRVPDEVGTALARAFVQRQKSDYGYDVVFDHATAAALMEDVTRVIEAVEAALS